MNLNEVPNLIVTHLAGSHAYGTNIATSDVDVRGMFCAKPEQIRTPFHPIREVTLEDHEDGKLFELTNYMKLYLDANPNVLETLWVDRDVLQHTTPAYDILRMHNKALLSRKVAFTYSGYALAQYKRLKNHNANQNRMWILFELKSILQNALNDNLITGSWINYRFGTEMCRYLGVDETGNTDIDSVAVADLVTRYNKNTMLQMSDVESFYAPVRKDYVKMLHNYSSVKLFKRDFDIKQFRNGYAMIPFGDNTYGLIHHDSVLYNNDGAMHKTDITAEMQQQPPLMILKLIEQQYVLDRDAHHNFWEWRNNRNATRAAMEASFGYDGKAAMHTVRLLRTAKEVLETGEIKVRRADAAELLAIRNGEWSYQELMEYVNTMDTEIRGSCYTKSDLPYKPDLRIATSVLMNVQDSIWGTKK